LLTYTGGGTVGVTEGRDGAVMGQKPMQFVGCRSIGLLHNGRRVPFTH
jgi:hypothetical protein